VVSVLVEAPQVRLRSSAQLLRRQVAVHLGRDVVATVVAQAVLLAHQTERGIEWVDLVAQVRGVLRAHFRKGAWLCRG
jgi:antitoxin component of MazEF toxin-antitoxin module